ncbi:RNA polymerase sigma-70 factor [Mariniphaga sediminis]|jgi:RNA polymerase sigma-70 factor (ECF subfamily)|uniref:RNA polymerase sigma-70 factor n=1 Tax=Mariniphaga sediminis TaxID=1628158 RepID=A0A399D1V0_9BACT|nr:RNA polymerase sigma-70 factor [Mariniphaga sediminis]RIH65433.1 RNA polymerase sigma-70 factor [Mariniphaga sediminis]
MLKNDGIYVSALKLGNEQVFKKIMEHWYKKLFNFAKGYLNNDENAREVLQDVFLQLWEHRNNLADNTSLNAYLFTLTRNQCIDLIRREKLLLQYRTDKSEEYMQLSESFEALSAPVLDDIFTKEFQTEIDQTICSLPEQCQKVFLLSRKNGLKNREISEMLQLSPKTVESHITKALKTIRGALQQKFPGSFNFLLLILKNMPVFSLKE